MAYYSHHPLAPFGIGAPDNRHFQYAGVLDQDVLHLAAVDAYRLVQPAAIEQVTA